MGTSPAAIRSGPTLAILAGLSLSHLPNDLAHSLLPAIYPLLKSRFALDFGQIGLITSVFQVTAAILLPVAELYSERRPLPFSPVVGIASLLAGQQLLAVAPAYGLLPTAAGLVGFGSAIFHPEASRVARLAAGSRYGLAQSMFQVGGNAGTALGPLLAAFVVVLHGQGSVAWFSLAALAGMAVLTGGGRWYRRRFAAVQRLAASTGPAGGSLSRTRVGLTISVLLALIFPASFYVASFSSYYTFYLINRVGVPVAQSQVLLFVVLGLVAAGTILGGPIGHRLGRKPVIWGSILGVLPSPWRCPMSVSPGRWCSPSRSG
ncbi:Fosmidomycin resistance protein [Methylobacterium trifolii]|uniref:Fosmidomycin resistance protein n=1 Tax=Methylobacterium trifolii TaxID=1003092 RepID=A0ABQ4U504_9HYPH|nr:Fosmidomycin resistance protein [Methylobacterium trifolii]